MQVACFMLGLSSIVPQLILPRAANLADAAQRGKVIGSVMSELLIGILLSRTLSGAIGAWLGWRSMFWIAAVICIIIITVIYKCFPRNHPWFSGNYGSLYAVLTHTCQNPASIKRSYCHQHVQLRPLQN